MKKVTYPFLLLALILILIIVSVSVFTNDISNLNTELDKNTQLENSLQSKLTALKNSNVNLQVSADSQSVVAALPPINPFLGVMSNVRNQVQSLGLSLNSFSSSSVTSINKNKGLLTGEITTEIDGGYKQIVSLIEYLKTSDPLIRFDGIKIVGQRGLGVDSYRMTGDLFAYWAPLPTTIPAVSQPYEGLSSDEQSVLARVNALKAPVFNIAPSVTVVASTPSSILRTNPFSL